MLPGVYALGIIYGKNTALEGDKKHISLHNNNNYVFVCIYIHIRYVNIKINKSEDKEGKFILT